MPPASSAAEIWAALNRPDSYVFPIIGAQWGIVANLIEQVGVGVTVSLYGLAPEHGVDETYELLDRVYREAIVAHRQRIFLAGDSAGGGLGSARLCG